MRMDTEYGTNKKHTYESSRDDSDSVCRSVNKLVPLTVKLNKKKKKTRRICIDMQCV